MNAFALCELCHDNGPFYCCFSACHTCGDTANYCLQCWNKWISMCEEQGRIHANCPHCRSNLHDEAVHNLIGRPYDNTKSKLKTILEEETISSSSSTNANSDYPVSVYNRPPNSPTRCNRRCVSQVCQSGGNSRLGIHCDYRRQRIMQTIAITTTTRTTSNMTRDHYIPTSGPVLLAPSSPTNIISSEKDIISQNFLFSRLKYSVRSRHRRYTSSS